MGFDPHAQVYIGFPVEFIRESIVTGHDTKYNRDTGEPYQVPITKEITVIQSQSKNIHSHEEGWEYEGRPIGSLEGLEVRCSGYLEDRDPFIGVQICENNGWKESQSESVLKVPKEVEDFADKHDLEPKIILSTNF